ncbi:NAD-dependent epimerase/dehydratase family protein [Paenibacillus mesophilus]|uniref:NAD-dependent epimerase/dehydratase family protein n=1 Tax=Paenibacillus mesophilus TaxID=2582849 RepID=UPI00110D4D98|nr:NAD-dependent epimerase/dehydratase family protein [Paenibacillus mesophilus]TMV50059.1 NAD-dependent epimerase/dehydratase family protein [Paenibacillus mesophilus]
MSDSNKAGKGSPRAVRAIVTGATGMVGEGVVHECLNHPGVEAVLVINRKPCGITHPKLKELLVRDFFDLASIANELTGYNAVFFCLGVSSVGLQENEYHRLTYELTLHAAETFLRLNPGIVFCYVSGSGTDSTEQGKRMWARVKGKTENRLLQLPFRKAYMFRIGYVHPTKGLHNTHKYYYALAWLYPLWRAVFPNYVSTLRDVGIAMINTVNKGYDKSVLEVRDINALARK